MKVDIILHIFTQRHISIAKSEEQQKTCRRRGNKWNRGPRRRVGRRNRSTHKHRRRSDTCRQNRFRDSAIDAPMRQALSVLLCHKRVMSHEEPTILPSN